MPVLALVLVLLLPLVIVLLMPIILVQRYRVGTTRRIARPWLATVNVVVMLFSAAFFLFAAAVTGVWVPGALRAAVAGLALGGVLGLIGVVASRWEETSVSLHYTPSRVLVLFVTLAVTARILYGFWNGWMTLRASPETPLVAAFGVAGSMGASALVIGYYLAYAIGVRGRVSRWHARHG
jgi:hypothetical protein